MSKAGRERKARPIAGWRAACSRMLWAETRRERKRKGSAGKERKWPAGLGPKWSGRCCRWSDRCSRGLARQGRLMANCSGRLEPGRREGEETVGGEGAGSVV